MIVTTLADDGGAPTLAECTECQRGWTRPKGDPQALSLATWARTHRCTEALERLRTALSADGSAK
jgi:hypothetical protein